MPPGLPPVYVLMLEKLSWNLGTYKGPPKEMLAITAIHSQGVVSGSMVALARVACNISINLVHKETE